VIRAIAFIAGLAPAVAFAQMSGMGGSGGDAPGMIMHGPKMMHGQPMEHGAHGMTAAPTEPGQSAFAAIQEIVGILTADPKTDWSAVNIDALRQHLVDMNNVVLAASVKDVPVEGGMRFDVTGEGPVRDSVRRMVAAHAATMNGVDGWAFEAAQIDGGASLTVRPPAKDADKLRGLGFFGVLTLGMHHQAHHLMIARGQSPHG
jgi:hypothetical protein